MGLIPASSAFLTMLRRETSRVGALLLFDEVVTGFRVGLGGAAALYGITPDLFAWGKIIGGGFPAAAFGGKREIMDSLAPLGPVYQAGTLSGHPVAMEAGYQALRLCREPSFYHDLEQKASFLLEPVRAYIEKEGLALSLQQRGSLFCFFFGRSQVENLAEVRQCDRERFASFFCLLLEKGIYLSPSPFETHFISSVHTQENLAYTRDSIIEALSSA
jgi:glutamate-1-semialdehyde 2,1-aminomutase